MIRYFLEQPHLHLARGTEGASGYDLHYKGTTPLQLARFERRALPTGLYLDMPIGVEAQVRPRGGLAIKHGITVLNTPGTVDSDYRGEVMVILINLGEAPCYTVNPEDRIAQLVFMCLYSAPLSNLNFVSADPVQAIRRVTTYAELSKTIRGEGRFGSTGT